MSHFGTHARTSRIIFPSNRKESDLRFELGASKAIWSHWFRRDKAFATKTVNRTYAQVVSYNKPCNLVSNHNPKRVPIKPTIKNFQVNSPNCVTSTSCACVQQPLHNKYHHVTAPVLLNNRFEALASHTDTSDAILEETLVNKVPHSQCRVNTKQAMPFASSDEDCNDSDPACQVLLSKSQVTTNTGLSFGCKHMLCHPLSLSITPNVLKIFHVLDK